MKYITLASFAHFLLYAVSGIGLLGIFTAIYLKLTPYHEFAEIKKGNCAPSISLAGALLGFTVPLILLSYIGVNYVDFLIWSGVVGAIQIGVFKALYSVIPMQIDEDNCSIALVYAVLAVCTGLIVGFSLIPS